LEKCTSCAFKPVETKSPKLKTADCMIVFFMSFRF
jgi:hypothetical protein